METRLNIAGVTVSVAHRYDLTDAWCCAGHETAAEPQFTVSATEEELGQEFDRLKGRFDLAACEGNCLYRRAALGMLDYDGCLLHATAVAVDGAGYVFTAPGGTGKSTHAGLWMQVFGPRALMVNGDKPILRRMEGGFSVCGTPWRGKERLGCAAVVPLRGVCLLERGGGERHRARRPGHGAGPHLPPGLAPGDGGAGGAAAGPPGPAGAGGAGVPPPVQHRPGGGAGGLPRHERGKGVR
ncbi:MAG: hypothetical protein LUE61_00270 [Clostridiales bacterium]|nr:hypothetical protein [Clostridiales bacterium]